MDTKEDVHDVMSVRFPVSVSTLDGQQDLGFHRCPVSQRSPRTLNSKRPPRPAEKPEDHMQQEGPGSSLVNSDRPHSNQRPAQLQFLTAVFIFPVSLKLGLYVGDGGRELDYLS